MHEVTREDHRGDAQPDPSVINGESNRRLGKNQREDNQRKNSAADPMLVNGLIFFNHMAQGLKSLLIWGFRDFVRAHTTLNE